MVETKIWKYALFQHHRKLEMRCTLLYSGGSLIGTTLGPFSFTIKSDDV